jgi:hypothetical protein
MEKFDRPNLRSLRPELEKALADVCAKHGITATIGSGSFTEFECKFKLILNLEGSNESNTESNSQFFELYAKSYGLEPTDLGKTFMVNNNLYVITGINPNRPKFPIAATRSDGKKFKFPALTVKAALARNRPVINSM